jgi:hypothetical protein
MAKIVKGHFGATGNRPRSAKLLAEQMRPEWAALLSGEDESVPGWGYKVDKVCIEVSSDR